MIANYDRDFEECRIPLLLPMMFFYLQVKMTTNRFPYVLGFYRRNLFLITDVLLNKYLWNGRMAVINRKFMEAEHLER